MESANAGKETTSTAAPEAKVDEAAKQTLLSAPKVEAQSGQPGEKAAPAKEEKPAPVAFDLKAPEGAALDAKHIEGLVEFAKANGMTPEAAQKALERDVAILAARDAAAAKDWHERQVPEWKAELKNDKAIGGDKFAETDRLATLAISKFGPPGMLKKLHDSGFAFEPDFVRMMRNAGAALSEPKRLEGGAAPMSAQNKLASIYNNPTSAPLFANAGKE